MALGHWFDRGFADGARAGAPCQEMFSGQLSEIGSRRVPADARLPWRMNDCTRQPWVFERCSGLCGRTDAAGDWDVSDCGV